jgi:hypothetical protein
MADWVHEMLAILSAGNGKALELVNGRWVPIPSERCTDEYKQREMQRLTDELGRRLGIGDYPGQVPAPSELYVGLGAPSGGWQESA